MRRLTLAAALAVFLLAPLPSVAKDGKPHGPSPAAGKAIAQALADPRRSEANRARDQYRHPQQTLDYFGVAPGQTVVEFSPGAGWYSEILAPLLKGGGHYVALVNATPRAQDAATKLFAAKADWFGPAEIATVDFASGATTLKPNSADVVLTFRNVHNLVMAGEAAGPNVFAAFYKALKPGGVLGVVDHRLPEARDAALEKKSGYIKRSTIVRLAEQAGFRLVGESEINANPRDKADYPDGVWTLPPTLKLGETDKAKYLAIGESDRQTLKFVKPGS